MHLQDHGGQIYAAYFCIGICLATAKILFRIKPVANARGDSTTAALTLVSAGLTNRFYRQTLKFRAIAVTTNSSKARVNDITDVRHCKRGLRNIGRQHNTSLCTLWVEYAPLVRKGQSGV